MLTMVLFTPRSTSISDSGFGFGSWLWNQIQRLLRLLLVGALAIWLAPSFIGTASQILSERLWFSLGWGALTPIIFLTVLVLIVMASILIGFPALVFGTLIFGFLLTFFYLGAIVVGQCLGHWILKKLGLTLAESTMGSTLIGLVGVWLLTVIPILGGIVGFFVALFGLGGLLLAGREYFRGASVDSVAVAAA